MTATVKPMEMYNPPRPGEVLPETLSGTDGRYGDRGGQTSSASRARICPTC